jgi:hypothetical protein
LSQPAFSDQVYWEPLSTGSMVSANAGQETTDNIASKPAAITSTIRDRITGGANA